MLPQLITFLSHTHLICNILLGADYMSGSCQSLLLSNFLKMLIIIQIQSNFYPILLILSCLFLVLVIKHCLSMFITTFLLFILPYILSKSNTNFGKIVYQHRFSTFAKKKKLATPGCEPQTACMLNGSATPRPRGKVEFKRKNLLTH